VPAATSKRCEPHGRLCFGPSIVIVGTKKLYMYANRE
jgi:hypothetical protein